jgi:hypothetical protein
LIGKKFQTEYIISLKYTELMLRFETANHVIL